MEGMHIEKKRNKVEHSETYIEVYVGQIKVGVHFVNVEILDVYFTNQNDEILVKLSTLIGALKNEKMYRIGQLVNRQLLMSEYNQKPISEGLRPC